MNEDNVYRGKPCKRGHIGLRYKGNGACRDCDRLRYARNPEEYKHRSTLWRRKNKARGLLTHARARAAKRGLPFNLVLGDVIIPEVCPVLNIPILVNGSVNSYNLASIDRIDNEKGYTKDNIIVVSRRANSLKSNASMKELRLILDFYTNLENKV